MHRTVKSLIAGSVTLFACSSLTVVSARTIQVTLNDGRISPARISAVKGVEVDISVRNEGGQVHNFVIPDFYIYTPNLNPGERTSASFVPDKTGEFPYYSDKHGTPERGMQGTISVAAGP